MTRKENAIEFVACLLFALAFLGASTYVVIRIAEYEKCRSEPWCYSTIYDMKLEDMTREQRDNDFKIQSQRFDTEMEMRTELVDYCCEHSIATGKCERFIRACARRYALEETDDD